MELEPLGDSALLLSFGEAIDPALSGRLQALAGAAGALPGVRATVPAYASLAVHFDPLACDPGALAESLRRLAAQPGPVPPARTVVVPVRYDGPDLEAVARHCRLGPEDVVRRHAAGVYQVHFLGFLPGFGYLGGLDPALATPRLATPRPRVPAGSVGIGGAQTGIYPVDAPGGWNLIGRTGLALFDPDREEPCLLRPGDRVRFEPVP